MPTSFAGNEPILNHQKHEIHYKTLQKYGLTPTTEAPTAGWQAFGPFGSGVVHLRAFLLRRPWLALALRSFAP